MALFRQLRDLAERFAPPGRLVTPALRDLAAMGVAAAAELEHNILPFWLAHARNPKTGGFWGEVTSGLRPRRTRLRSAILASRILWTFAAAYRRVRPDPQWLAMARYARDELLRTFGDREYGGIVWSAEPDGRVRDDRKQIYAQSFAIYGLAEYCRATGDETAREEAIALYRLTEAHAWDPIHGGYFDLCRRDWSRPEAAEGAAVKSVNTMLHVLEAYANLLRAWPDAELRRRLVETIELILSRTLDAAAPRLIQSFTADWTPVPGQFSYGHDLEAAWLAVDAAMVAGDPLLLERVRSTAVAIAGRAADAADLDGGLIHEVGPDGYVDPVKHWWVQAEAAVGFLDAHEISGDEQLLVAARRSWAFIEHRLVDRRGGEWFAATTRSGRPVRQLSKIGFWKCPYHNGRACMEIAERAARLSAPRS